MCVFKKLPTSSETGSIFSWVLRFEIMYLDPLVLFTKIILFKFLSFLAILSFLFLRIYFFWDRWCSYSSNKSWAALDLVYFSISSVSNFSLKMSKKPPFLTYFFYFWSGFFSFISFFSNFSLFLDFNWTGASSSADNPNSSFSAPYSPKIPPPSDATSSEESSLILRPLLSWSYYSISCFFTIFIL